MNHSILRRGAVALLFSLTACGPIAIGAGLASAGGGGGTSVVDGTPSAPTLVSEAVLFQPEDDATLVRLRLAQSRARPVRLRFEYDLGDGRTRVPAANLGLYNPQIRASGGELEVDGEGNFRVATTSAGRIYHFLWQHAVDLGQIEKRGVTLFAVFVDADEREDFASEAANSVAVLSDATVGRELSELGDVQLTRTPGDFDGPFTLTATLRDGAGDRATTELDFQFAVTPTPPGDSDWVALDSQQPVTAVDEEEPDGRIRSDLLYRFDPVALALPFGHFDKFWFRVRQRESYPQSRDDTPAVIKEGAFQELSRDDEQIGFAPIIEFAKVIDPGSPQTSIGDDDRPWLKLPIAMRIFNPSTRTPLELRVDGTYTIASQTFAITPFESGEPLSDTVFTLPPQTRSAHYLVWNVVADEGLGNTTNLDPPNSLLRVADIEVAATALSAAGLQVVGGPLRATATAGSTTLSTNPFVTFRDNLIAQGRRIWSSGDDITQRTRDLFYTLGGTVNPAQEFRLGLDQQFEPVQIVPPPPEFEFSESNGVFDIVPSDFVAGVPDGLVWINNKFFHVTWPDSTGADAEFLGSATALSRRGGFPADFTLSDGTATVRVALFFTWSEVNQGTFKDVSIRMTRVVRTAAGAWTVTTQPTPDAFRVEGTPPVNVQLAAGDFDGNPATYEVVFGTQGTEAATTANPGLLHMWSFALSGGVVTQSAPVALPAVPAAAGNPTMDPWLMTSWQRRGQTRPGLVVVRQLNGFPRRFDVWTLDQQAGGGFAPAWTLVSDALASSPATPGFDVGNQNLRRIFAKDLDGNSGGLVGSDLLLVLDERISSPLPAQRFADIWLLADRQNGPLQWRRIIDHLQVIDPDTLDPIVGEMDCSFFQLVDVNGDRQLDLVTCEGLGAAGLGQANRSYNYLASSLTGVAGRLGSVGSSAGATQFRSVLPGLVDANRDGYMDLISGARLHLANVDGSYTQASGAFSGAVTSRHQVERVMLDQGDDSIEVIISDPSVSIANAIDRIGGLGTGAFAISTLLQYDLGGNEELVRALMAPDSAARLVKDLVGFVSNGGNSTLRRGRIDTAASTVSHSQLWNGTPLTGAGLALIRRGALQVGETPAGNLHVQDVVVVDASAPTRFVLLRSDDDYAAPQLVSVPAGQSIVRIGEGAVTEDSLEDLLVLTVQTLAQGLPNESQVFRLLCYPQGAGGIVTTPVQLARFGEPFADPAVRSMQFDRSARSLAGGFLLFDDAAGVDTRSQVRLLRPIVDAAGVAARVVLSPIDAGADEDFDTVVLDVEQDGQIEVLGGSRSVNLGLRRMRTNVVGGN